MTPEEHFDLGNDALAIGELETAGEHYRQATQLQADYFAAWHALTMVFYKQGRYPEAIEAGLKASHLNPNDMMIWTSLSMAYMKNGQIAEAEAAGGKAKVISWGGRLVTE
jgi:tetratricopeptide (TPR) repeat protein